MKEMALNVNGQTVPVSVEVVNEWVTKIYIDMEKTLVVSRVENSPTKRSVRLNNDVGSVHVTVPPGMNAESREFINQVVSLVNKRKLI